MAKMKAVQVKSAKGPFEVVEKEVPVPGPKQARIKIKACGICHSDSFTKDGSFPNIKYPRVPGHEVAGVIDAVGPNIEGWKVGDKVGVGWHGGQCGHCESCRRGDFSTCEFRLVSGISYDGGYAEYMVAPQEALALIPDDMPFSEAAPLMCAGVTTYNSLRNSGARPGDLVAVQGIGGLGHLGVQFAAKMGFKTVAIARGADKEALAKKLGAWRYIDSQKQNPADELKKLGGAKVIITTVTDGKTMSSVVDGLSTNGKLIILGAAQDPIVLTALSLIGPRRSILGWPSGSSIDSQDTMAFSALRQIRPMIEEFPLEKASEAYDHMMSGKARFRVVLKMN